MRPQLSIFSETFEATLRPRVREQIELLGPEPTAETRPLAPDHARPAAFPVPLSCRVAVASRWPDALQLWVDERSGLVWATDETAGALWLWVPDDLTETPDERSATFPRERLEGALITLASAGLDYVVLDTKTKKEVAV